jgi:hypothetical protein
MHQALEEDKQNRPTELTDTSAYAFVKLDYKQQKQYFGNKDISKLKEIGNRANNDLKTTLLDLLNSKPVFKNKLSQIENDIGIVYALRNPAVHRIRDRPFIHQNFKQIVDRLFNVFFLAVENLYI